MKRIAKVVLLSVVACSFVFSSCARRQASQQAPAVPSYVQTGK